MDRPRRAGLREDEAAVVPPAGGRRRRRRRSPATTRSSCRATARGALFVPHGPASTGRCPTHYEPVESPFRNPLYGQQGNPTRKEYPRPDNPINPSPPAAAQATVFPYVFTTSRLTEHHTAGGMSRYLPYLVRAAAGDVRRGLARAGRASGGSSTLGWCHVVTARAAIEGRVLVTDRLTPLRVEGRHGAPGVAALPLGRRRAWSPATRRTTCSASRWTRTC